MTATARGTDTSGSPAEINHAQQLAVRLVLAHIDGHSMSCSITSPWVVTALCALVVEGLTKLDAAESVLTDEQRDALWSGNTPESDSLGFAREMMQDVLGRLMLAEIDPG